jgi:hypothetical protein
MTSRPRNKRPSRPGTGQLREDPHFKQILELDFGEMIPFVLTNIKRRSFISLFYATINIALLLYIITLVIQGLVSDQFTWLMVLKQTFAGIFTGSFLIIPVHELFHGIAYRILGARKIRFGADMQQLVFYVTADRYPVSGSELYFLALLPFVAINLIAIMVFILWVPQFILFGSFMLLCHNIMCIGDYAIVNYVYHQAGKVFSYDVVNERKSYFFEKTD